MTLRSRLAVGLLAIAVILVAPLLLAVQSLERLHRDIRSLRDKEFSASLVLGQLREGMNDLRNEEIALWFVHNTKAHDAMVQGMNDVRAFTDSLDHYGLGKPASDIRDAVREMESWAPSEYNAALAERRNDADSISQKHFAPALARADTAIRVAERDLRVSTRRRVEGTAASIARAELMTVIALGLALVLAAVIAIFLTRAISRPVTELEHGMRAVSEGEFGHKLKLSPSRTDEFGRLAASFDTMTRQLTELDKLKAEFVSVASHELKTPINVVLGYLGLLEEGIYGQLTPEQQKVLQTLEAQMQSLARLSKQLLDVSRFEAGGGKLELRPIKLESLLTELQHGFGVLADQRGVRFTVTTSEGLPNEVLWDVDRINEVLGNLLSNAFKFTERGGEVELSVSPADGGVQMEVRDSGAGIPSEQLPHIFEKFYQASNQSAASASGSGLGLAIAKQIVEAHRGTITCESTPGVGTTFTILLPTRATSGRASRGQPVVAGAV
jgi:signal transduction histidine kinase